MAYIKRTRPTARRASVKKRTSATSRKTNWGTLQSQGVSVPRNMFGFPGSLTSIIRYSDTVSVSSGSGVSANGNVWRMNSVFDPDYTNLGHQPLYYDQFTAVYDNYVVLASKITATYSPNGDGAAPFIIGITSGNSTSFSNSVYTLQEQNKSVATICGDKDGTSVRTLSTSYTPQQCIGVSTNDDTVQSSISGNPAKPWFAYTWVQDRSGNTAACTVHVVIEYKVRFFGMKNVNSS